MAWRTISRPIRTGNAGNRETLRAMSSLASRASVSPVVIEAAQNAVRGTRERDDALDFEAVLTDVRRRMRYTHDPLDAEVVKDPVYVVARTSDPEASPEPMDCDDASTLTAAMLGALGYATRFATVAADPTRPTEWSHVYVHARRNDGRWVALDPIVRRFGVGDEVPDAHVTARAVHAGVPMPMYPRSRMSGLGTVDESAAISAAFRNAYGDPTAASVVSTSDAGSQSWWERLFDSGSKAAATVLRARRKPADVRIINKGGADGPGFFQKKDEATGEVVTDWAKVGLVGAGVFVGGALLLKLTKGR